MDKLRSVDSNSFVTLTSILFKSRLHTIVPRLEMNGMVGTHFQFFLSSFNGSQRMTFQNDNLEQVIRHLQDVATSGAACF